MIDMPLPKGDGVIAKCALIAMMCIGYMDEFKD